MNTINDVQLRTAGTENSAPATTTTKRPSELSEQGFVLLKSGHRDRRFGTKPLLGKDTCGY
jgi:hypothetical protein